MKNIRIISLLLALVLALSLTACGGGDKDKDSGGSASTDVFANIDMKSTEEQDVCDERASMDVLSETFNTYLGGLNYFAGTDMEKLTYADLKEHIGVDCTAYLYDDTMSRGVYIWKVDGRDTAYLSLFLDSSGKLVAAGATNLS